MRLARRDWVLPSVIFATVLAACVALCYMFFMPGFVRSGTTKTNAIINNLRQLEGAKEQWALDHSRTGAVAVTKADLAPYLPHAVWVKPVAGETYTVTTLLEPVQAQLNREVDGKPKGTLIRLGTNSIGIISPPD